MAAVYGACYNIALEQLQRSVDHQLYLGPQVPLDSLTPGGRTTPADTKTAGTLNTVVSSMGISQHLVGDDSLWSTE